MGETRRTTPFVALTALCTAALLATAGCATGETPRPSATPTTPATASDEAILAAAIDAYTRYSAAFDAVRGTAPADADHAALKAAVTDDYWTLLADELGSETREWRQRGSSQFGDEQLVESSWSAGEARAVMTVCVDLTHTSLIDQAGNEIAAPDRRLRFPMKVTVEGDMSGPLLVADAVAMEADESCG